MTEEQGTALLASVAGLSARLDSYAAAQPMRDAWLMVLGVAVLICMFCLCARFWRSN